MHFAVSLPLHWIPQVVPVPTPEHAARAPIGLPETGEQVPALPERLHAAHWSPHALSQHTPSTQLVLVHSVPVEQVAPLVLSFRQVKPEQ